MVMVRLRGLACREIALHADVEAVDDGRGDRFGGRCGLVGTAHLHRGRQGQTLTGVRGNEVCEDPVGPGRLPLPGDRPGAVVVHLGMDMAKVLAVGANGDQVQFLFVLQARSRSPGSHSGR